MSERDRSPTPELWDKYQAAEYLGIQPDSIRRDAHRRGIRVAERRLDKQGRSHALYRADDIRNRRPTS